MTIYHLPFTIYYLPFTIFHLPFTISQALAFTPAPARALAISFALALAITLVYGIFSNFNRFCKNLGYPNISNFERKNSFSPKLTFYPFGHFEYNI